MKAFKIAGITLLLLIALVLVFVAFILPGMVRTRAVAKIEELTGRKASIAGIAVDPLTLTVRVNDFKVKERDGTTTFASFSSATVSASIRSLVKGRPVLDRASLVAPYVHVVRTGQENFNFSDIEKRLKEEWQEEEKKEQQPGKKGLTRFSIHDISLTNGTVRFIDRAAPAGTISHMIRNIDLSIPAIGTMREKKDDPVSLEASAVINGSPLKVTGNARPFAEPPAAALHISLQKVDIPFYGVYVPKKLPLVAGSGSASLGVDVAYAGRGKEKDPVVDVAGYVTIDDLRLKDRHKAPLFALGMLRVDIRSTDLAAREVNLDGVRVESFDLYASRNRRGVWNFSRVADALSEMAAGDSETEEKTKFKIRVAQTMVREGSVHLIDRSVSTGFKSEVRDISLDMGKYSTEQEGTSPIEVSLRTAKGEKATLTGSVAAKPPLFDGKFSVSGIDLADYTPYLTDFLSAPVKGTIASSGQVLFRQQQKELRVSDLEARVKGLYAPFGNGDFARVGTVAIRNGYFNRKPATARLGELLVKNGTIAVTRSRDGTLSAMNILKEPQRPKPPAAEKRSTDKLLYSIRHVGIDDVDVTFRDRSLASRPADFNLHDIAADIRDVHGPDFKEMPYRLSTRYGRDGSIELSGSVRPEPLKLNTHAVVRNIPLTDFAPYAAEKVAVVIAAGRLGADIRADVVKQGEQLAGAYAGSMQISSLRLQDPKDRANLLLWETLRIEDLRGTLQPLAVAADRVLVSEYYANIVINQDGTINFRRILKRDGGETVGKAAAKSRGERPEKPKAAQPDIRLGTVTLENGVLDFKDYSLDPRHYATRFVQLGGRISGLSSEPGTRADVDLRGALENRSPLRISGKMNPLADPLYVDLKVDFDNIALPRFSPYAAKYLGYRIEQGKLRATLDYKIEDEKIEASNRILIDQLFFGREVDSEQAVNLPVSVPTAVGLLKGPKGKIELDVPVAGRTDNPEIGMGQVVWEAVKKAFKGFFRKIFTNPFSFLFGDKGEEFRTIYFEYGSPVLGNEQKRSLAVLAEKLADRPGLKLDVTGYVDPERDPEGYRRYLVHERMRMAKYLDRLQGPQPAPQAGHIPENVQITPEDRHEYLKRVYEQADFPKPKTAFRTLKKLPDEEMRKLLLAHTVVGERQLRELSRLRSQAVRDFLSGTGKVDPSRLFLRIGAVTRSPEEPVKSNARVEFSLAKEKGD